MEGNGNVVSSYLLGKFSSTLKEADLSSYPVIKNGFKSIRDKMMDCKKPADLVGLVHDLMGLLSECILYQQSPSTNILMKTTFQSRIMTRLDEIDTKLNQLLTVQVENDDDNNPINMDLEPDGKKPGFESYLGEIESYLIPKEGQEVGFKSVGIFGSCGAGKTELALQVFSRAEVEKTFFPRIWVGLSEALRADKDLKESFLIEILRETGMDLEEGDHSLVELRVILRRRLIGKRYLIVLDDTWRIVQWLVDLVQNDLPKGSGGAVVVTSRVKNVIEKMVGGNAKIIQPQLSPEICWNIFKQAVKKEELEKGMRLGSEEEMKNYVSIHSQNLPLAALILADAVSNLPVEQS